MTKVMAWLAARSLPGIQMAPADDGTPMALVQPRLPNRYEGEGGQVPAQDFDREDIYPEAATALRREPPPPVRDRHSDPERPTAQPSAVKSPPPEAPAQH